MRIAVEEWELYNNRILLCKWFNTEEDTEEEINDYIKEAKKKYGLNSEDIESFIVDVEDDDLNMIESEESIYRAYEVQELRNSIEDCDLPKIGFLSDCQGFNIEEAIGKVDDCICYEDTSFEQLAIMFVEEGLMGENLKEQYDINSYYIDFEAIASDLQFDYTEYDGDIFRCD